MTRRQRVYGVTKCIACRKSFAPGEPVSEIVTQEQPWRMSSSGQPYRGQWVDVTVKWHTRCLDEEERRIEAYRQRVADENARLIAELQGGISMTTTQPDLLSVAAMHEQRADSWWRDCAERAVRELAGRGQPFTADDLTDLGVPNPDIPARWGSLFAAMKAAGVIQPVGYRASTRATRNGGVTRVWRGIPRTSSAARGGEARAADEPQGGDRTSAPAA